MSIIFTILPSVVREFSPLACVPSSLPLAGLPALPFTLRGTVSPVRRPASSFLLPFPLPLAGAGAEGGGERADPVRAGDERSGERGNAAGTWEEVTSDEGEGASDGRGLLFVGDLIAGFPRHRRRFLRVRVGLAFLVLLVFPFSLYKLKETTYKTGSRQKSTITAAAHPANLIGLRSKEAGTCQIQVADGCDGDSVVGVVVLHRLCGVDYGVL